MSFRGWPSAAVEFYERLEADNSKAFWQANKHIYDEQVKGPMEALSDEIATEFGPMKIFRPHRDVRFSKDKAPYKTWIGGVTEGDGGEAYYVGLSAEGLMTASGYWHMAKDQLEKFYEAIDRDKSGNELVALVATARKARLEVGGEALKTAPRGYARDHPRIELLRHKGLTVAKTFGTPKWVSTRAALKRITDTWRAAKPIHAWLGKHVGPSEEPPPEEW